MSELTFKGFKDAGAPTLSQVDGIMSVAYAAGERGRFLTENITAAPGEAHRVTGEYRVSQGATAAPVIVFWKAGENWQFHSSEQGPPLTAASEAFAPFEIPFTVPEGADSFRVELRAWTGSGVSEFRDVELDPPIAPEPEPEPEPDLPKREWTGFVRGRMLTLQQETTPEAEAVEWPCLPVVGVEWGGDLYLTIVQPEPEAE